MKIKFQNVWPVRYATGSKFVILTTKTENNIWKQSASHLNIKDDDCLFKHLHRGWKKFYCSFWGVLWKDFTRINKEYDQLMLDLEAELRSTIRYSEDPLKPHLFMPAPAAISIFAALPEVSKGNFLFQVKTKDDLDEQEYRQFCQDMKKAENVVYITDNCGEIVLDKIAIQILKDISKYTDHSISTRTAR